MPYFKTVSLDAKRSGSSTASIKNLSRSGVCVSGRTLPVKGDQVTVGFNFRQRNVTAEGRVAWLKSAKGKQPSLAGIRFLNLDASTRALLEDVEVARASLSKPQQDEREPVSVWFDGLPHAVKTRARRLGDVMEFSTALPFLKLGSSVRVESQPEEDQQLIENGKILSLTLEASDVGRSPRIVVTVRSAIGSDIEADSEFAPSASQVMAPIIGASDSEIELEDEDLELLETNPAAVDSTPEPEPLETKPEALEAKPERIIVDSTFLEDKAEKPAVVDEPAESLSNESSQTVPAIVAAAEEVPSLKGNKGAWMGRAALGLSAVATAAVAVWVTSQQGTSTAPAPTVSQPAAAVAPSAEPVTQPIPTPEAAVEQPKAVTNTTARLDMRPRKRNFSGFTLDDAGDTSVLRMRIWGDMTIKKVLSLAPEPGIVAILPRAHSSNDPGRYRLATHPLVQRVVVEERVLGLYVRMMFARDDVDADVVAQDGLLKITIKQR